METAELLPEPVDDEPEEGPDEEAELAAAAPPEEPDPVLAGAESELLPAGRELLEEPDPERESVR